MCVYVCVCVYNLSVLVFSIGFLQVLGVRFKVFIEVMILMMLFSVKVQCGVVGRSQHFGEACSLHLHG
jgi:hypothetical protein